jgi:hypothetical protein
MYSYLNFYPSFFTFSFFHRLDLVFVASIPWVTVVFAYLSSRYCLVGGEVLPLSVGGVPDCRRN